ncbi:NAD-dependent epimerase/dehydratase family protein [uncultured Bacteroides sp.]|uniref:NAD-dependent epimerase/dehydratase family protein n=1 Tax=uncultured Bacteroides sp. TaxID=162156 RepID=UPI002AA6F1DB|nr:NAD-dependent epimerase/dehydratase family protein [uncultured Bacteroides sp.]
MKTEKRTFGYLVSNAVPKNNIKVFITGVTGYIGGSVAERLVSMGYDVSGLVRTTDNAELLAKRNIRPIIGSLDDFDVMTKAAQSADIVINAANADHIGAVITLVTALEHSGKLLIHTSGSSIVADHADGAYGAEPLTEDDFFEPLPSRRARIDMNRYVRQAAIDKGIRTIVICPSMIYGEGKGMQVNSDQIPKLIDIAKHIGAGPYFGAGLNRYSNVYIDDLIDLYILAIEKAPGGSFFFAENGFNSFIEIAKMISTYLGLGGEITDLTVEHVINDYGEEARLGVTSNSVVKSLNARLLGWHPHGLSLEKYLENKRVS